MPHRNLAVELLQKLLQAELSIRRGKNVVQARTFSQMLEETLGDIRIAPFRRRKSLKN